MSRLDVCSFTKSIIGWFVWRSVTVIVLQANCDLEIRAATTSPNDTSVTVPPSTET